MKDSWKDKPVSVAAALSFVVVLLLFSGEAPAQGNWQAEWKKILAAAEKEGQLSIGGPPGDTYRLALMEVFQKKYPKIKVEWDGGEGRVKIPKILRERNAGIFNMDLYLGGSGSPLGALKPIGAFDPLRPEAILPDVLDDGKWHEGFNAGFVDTEKKFIYAYDGTTQDIVWVNRDVVPINDLKAFKELLDPKWGGKIVWDDPRREGSGLNTAQIFLLSYGEDFLKKLLSEQKIVFTLDRRQLTEWVVRGRYPIGISLPEDQLKIFLEKGVGKNLLSMEDHSLVKAYSQGFGSVAVFNRRPHPNATKVYLNWLLSKEGQTSWVGNTLSRNSRRLDVVPGDTRNVLRPNEKYKNTQAEEFIPMRAAIMKLAKDLIRE
ncbi:MAG TPA: extracellular solute-binding protein [Candidatus Binatia bacterium]|jgi:iron(III) transport system substrate-binding protein